MQGDVLDEVSADLLTIPPLIFRSMRRKLFRLAIGEINVDISPLHFEIMALLRETGALHVAEISQRLQIARPQMTHLTDKLVDLEIVERQADTGDRRMTNVVLTARGRGILEEHDSNIRNAARETLSCLKDRDLKELSASLRKLRDIFSKLK
ncbi:MarR family winged helix-turn-helix transcriptional regulator [Chloroflexota bacterium]